MCHSTNKLFCILRLLRVAIQEPVLQIVHLSPPGAWCLDQLWILKDEGCCKISDPDGFSQGILCCWDHPGRSCRADSTGMAQEFQAGGHWLHTVQQDIHWRLPRIADHHKWRDQARKILQRQRWQCCRVSPALWPGCKVRGRRGALGALHLQEWGWRNDWVWVLLHHLQQWPEDCCGCHEEALLLQRVMSLSKWHFLSCCKVYLGVW